MPVNKQYELFEFLSQKNFFEPGAPIADVNRRFLKSRFVRDGVANPFWKQKVANGVSASTPMVVQTSGIKWEGGYARGTSWYPVWTAPDRKIISRYTGDFINQFCTTPSFYTIPLTQAHNQALIRLYKAIRQEAYQISGPVFLGELRETINMIRNPAASLVNYTYRYLQDLSTRRGPPRSSRARTYREIRRARRVVADTWLEYSFGFSPLLADVKAAAETLARVVVDNRRSQVRGFGEYNEPVVFSRSTGTTPVSIPFFYHRNEGAKGKVIYRAGLGAKATIASTPLERVIELSGFQIQNFVPTIYELIPFSWMADYFSNLGQVLEAGCTDTSEVTWVQYNEITEVFDDFVLTLNQTNWQSNLNNLSLSGSLGRYYSFNRRITRVPSGLKYPSLTFQLPGQTGQLANLAAVFSNARRLQPFI